MGWQQSADGTWHEAGDPWWPNGYQNQDEPYPDEPDPDRPKRSIWDDDQGDNPAKDWEYDEDEDPARMPDNPNRGWFGNNERDETDWSRSSRGVNSWDLNYRNQYERTGDNPHCVKRGSLVTRRPRAVRWAHNGRKRYRKAKKWLHW